MRAGRARVEALEGRALMTVVVGPPSSGIPGTGNASLSFPGEIASPVEVDTFTFSLAQGESARIRPGAGDYDFTNFTPAVQLLDATGDVKASSVDGRGFEYTARADGTYTLRVSADNLLGTYVRPYNVTVETTAFGGTGESEPNETQATADPTGANSSFRGIIGAASNVDYFSFNGTAGQAVAIKFTDRPGRNPAVRLFAPAGNQIAINQSGTGLTATLPTTGTYAFSVMGDNSAGSVTGAYVGQITTVDRPTAESEGNNSFSSATPWGVGGLHHVPTANLGTTAALTTNGLTGSYLNHSMFGESTATDWRATQTVAGTRVDPEIRFPSEDFGNRASLNLTGGTSSNWDLFSVQWDGFVRVDVAGTKLYTATDDGSRMWIDLNNDGNFNPSGVEFINNNFGGTQGTTVGPASVALAVGTYRVRVQYYENFGGNNAFLLWDDSTHSAGAFAGDLNEHAVGTLADSSDVDVYAVDLVAGNRYEFRVDNAGGATVGRQGRVLTLHNEFGQQLEYGVDAAVHSGQRGLGMRVERTGRHFLTVQASDVTGLGAYSIDFSASAFPTQRDVPVYYHDLSGWTATDEIPSLLNFFASRYDIYNVDITATQPAGGEYVSWRQTNTPSNGSGGSAGGGYGTRRPSGGGSGNIGNDPERLADMWYGLEYHENGHATGLHHSRHPLATMSYGGQGDVFPIGSWFSMNSEGGGGDAFVAGPERVNERDYLDFTLQAGRIAGEIEPNNARATAQSMDGYLAEMTGDADARNDQVTMLGRLGTASDVDFYAFTATAAGQMFALDIEAAEFQDTLDAALNVYDAAGNVLATSLDALDRTSGIASVDPYVLFTAPAAGVFTVGVSAQRNTFGNYRLRLTPSRAFDAEAPRIIAAWPDTTFSAASQRVLKFWTNDQIDPATLTAANVNVVGNSTGVRAGTAIFDAQDSTIVWRADAALPPDTYTVRLRGTAGTGISDLRGNRLDGETDGSFAWPEVSGNGAAGGDFVMNFTVTGTNTSPAAVTDSRYERHPHNRGMFVVDFNDTLDVLDVYAKGVTVRGAGPDAAFNTADDRLLQSDLLYDKIGSTVGSSLLIYTRGVPDSGRYRLEASFLDAAGNTVNLSREVNVASVVPVSALGRDAALTQQGLTGTYVNTSLRGYAPQDDWRVTQTIAGTRTDSWVHFDRNSWGTRSSVGLTGGTDADWDNYSVQWDGFVRITDAGTRLFTNTDDGSRLWIDLNNDGVFNASGPEFVNNNWGNGQGTTLSPASQPLPAGTYRVRVQYEEGAGGNQAFLMWDAPSGDVTQGGYARTMSVADVNIQPNSTTTTRPSEVAVTFSGAANVSSLTTSNFVLRRSTDPTFFDGNDTFVTDADGILAWDATLNRVTLTPSTPLADGYYLIELEADAGGITSLSGRALDGEYLDSHIEGNTSSLLWRETPSGDGRPGGDYRAYFRVSADPVDVPPAVTQVFVAGSAWTANFNNFIATSGAGESAFGFRIDAASQTDELPWVNLNKVSIRFSENVIVAADDLVVRGVNNATYPLATTNNFTYDPVTFTATWTLATAGIINDKLLLDLDADPGTGVTDATGNRLDGEWTNPAAPAVGGADTYPSGDGTAGGDFRFRLNVLPGDVNRSGGSVIGSDVTLVRNSQNFSPGSVGYTIFRDVNGSASILGSDVTAVRNRQGLSLPAGEPAALVTSTSAPAVFKQVASRSPVLKTSATTMPTLAREDDDDDVLTRLGL